MNDKGLGRLMQEASRLPDLGKVRPLDQLVKVYHLKASCRKVAFYLDHHIVPGEPFRPELVTQLDGSHPDRNTPITCGSCKEVIPFNNGGSGFHLGYELPPLMTRRPGKGNLVRVK